MLDPDGRGGRQALQTPGSGELRDALAAVYGAEPAAAMLVVGNKEHETSNREAASVILVDGLVGPPQMSRASRQYLTLFVNRRWIQNRRLAFAVEEAYQGLLMTGHHPVAVLNLRVPPQEVDVNVHPTKAEVRFRDEGAIFGALQRAVRSALLTGAPVPDASIVAAAPQFMLSPQPSAPLLWEHGVRVAAATPPTAPAGRPAPNGGLPASDATPSQALPVLRVIGQMGATYIIAEGPDGMYLIDQHAAHERVLYERFWRKRQQGAPEVQGLLDPMSLELPSRERTLIAEQAESLASHGFEIEPFGDGACVLRALPRSLAGGDVRQSVLAFLDTMLEEGEGDRSDRVAMSLACHGAVRAGKTLSIEEMRELAQQLEESEAPNTCPHGRPTMIHLSAETLAREFGRR
jgi:DNA mismatch repair protein MutL